ncbi:MAG TPA: shikimate kinase [Coriobacteriia bacterium]
MDARHVLLVGFMGSGKTTVGTLLAERLGMPFVDLDREIVMREARTVSEIFTESGEAAFRVVESSALSALGSSAPSVVACGGGVVLDEGNRALLKRLGTVVYLRVTAEEACARIRDGAGRPLLEDAGRPTAHALLSARESLYEAVADVSVSTTGRTPDQVASAVVGELTGEAA